MHTKHHHRTGSAPEGAQGAGSEQAFAGWAADLQATQRMLAEAQAIAHLGGWEYDFAADRVMWSQEAYRIFGVDPATFVPSAQTVMPRIYPDDRERLTKDYIEAISDRRPHDVEFRIVRSDGAVRNIHARGSTFYDGEGKPLRLLGSIQDVTERRQMESRLHNSQLQLATALELTRAGPWEYDVATNLFTFNDTLYAVFGTTAEAVGGYQMTPEDYASRFVSPDDIPVIKGELQLALETSDPLFSRELEHHFVHANGEVGVLGVRFRVVQDETGRTIKVYGANQDITALRKMEKELTLSKAMSATAVECSVEGILIVNRERNIISHNSVFLEMWRVPKWLMEWGTDEALLRFLASQLKSPESAVARIEFLYKRANETGHDKLELKDGRVFDRDSVPLFDDNGQYLARAWFFRDITKRICAERSVRESEENLRTIFASVREGIFVMAPDTGRIVEVNPAGCKMFGYRRDEIIGANIGTLSSGDAPYSLEGALELIRAAPAEPRTMDWHCRAQGGRLFWAAVAVQRARFRGQMVLLATLRDVTARKEAEATIAELARYDPLTGLANRRVFVSELADGISRASSSGNLAVLFLDLDHFKDVNDTLGHKVGDLLLKEVAHRIRAGVRDIDTVSRFGGDEFAVIASDLAAPEDAAVLAEKLIGVLREPYSIEGNEIHSGTSIGIANLGPDSTDEDALLAHADVALYRAKTEGGGNFRFFTEEMDREVKLRVSLATELRSAIAKAEQLELFYQPQVDLNSGHIVGLEALVRWNHPKRGLLSPDEFIPIAERGGFISELGRWVIQEACRQAKIWLDLEIAPEFIGVNLSALQFKTPKELEKDIARALADNGLPASMLELELTETVLMQSTRRSNDCLESLRRKGIRLSIDDFGTGYSSLDYLRRFPAGRIKIAQSFVTDIERSQGNRTIVRAALGLARELGLTAIAEGIETHGQLMLLKSWGCREGQGYLFSRPVPADEMTQLLRGRRGVFAPKDETSGDEVEGAAGETLRRQPHY